MSDRPERKRAWHTESGWREALTELVALNPSDESALRLSAILAQEFRRLERELRTCRSCGTQR